MKLLHRLSITSTNAIFSIFPKSENQNITIPPSFKFPVVINIEKQESSYMEAITDSGLVSTNNGFDSAKSVDENMGKEILSGESVERRSLTIIVNCSSISYVDTMGVEALIEVLSKKIFFRSLFFQKSTKLPPRGVPRILVWGATRSRKWVRDPGSRDSNGPSGVRTKCGSLGLGPTESGVLWAPGF